MKSVNLPRWGLKLLIRRHTVSDNIRVNLPRWGLKLKIKRTRTTLEKVCKFTPLGFETLKKAFW